MLTLIKNPACTTQKTNAERQSQPHTAVELVDFIIHSSATPLPDSDPPSNLTLNNKLL